MKDAPFDKLYRGKPCRIEMTRVSRNLDTGEVRQIALIVFPKGPDMEVPRNEVSDNLRSEVR